MNIFKRLDHHADLVNRMANTVGADLEESLMRGQLSGQTLRSAVLRCVGCEGGSECPDWLAAHEAGSEQTPSYCRNSDLFAALKG